jgi:HK97 family phage major capsid protein
MNIYEHSAVHEARSRLSQAEANYNSLLTSVQKRIASLPDSASAADVDAIENEYRSKLDAAEASVTEARKAAETTQKVTEARAATRALIPAGDLSVREAYTYSAGPDSPSFIADLYAARSGNQAATERLQRNNREVAAETRSTLTSSDFYPPMYLASQAVVSMRPRLVYAGLVNNLPLPQGGETVTIPSYAGPATAANFQAGDNAAVQTAAGTTSQLSAPVGLAAGYLDLARQAIERAMPGLDQVVFGDISRDIAHQIEVACVNGSGTNQPKGILNDNSVPSVTVSGQTAAQFLLKLADLSQRIEVAVNEAPNFLVMHPRRWAWWSSLLDSSNRPLVVSPAQGAYNAFGTISNKGQQDGLDIAPDVTPVGYIAGLPVFTSSAIPTNSGAGTNEDWCILGVRELAVRWEDPAGIRQFSFEGVVSANASIRVQALTYSSYIHRYPAAFGVIKGLSQPAF